MDKSKLKNVIFNWDIGELLSHQQAKKGVVNINWILKTTKGKFVLRKVVSSKKVNDLVFELDYLTYLKQKQFPYRIPAPIKTKTNEFFTKFEGAYFWIYEYIEGRNLKRFEYSELRECAKMMALYHKIIENSNLNNQKGSGDVFNRKPVIKELEMFRSSILKKSKQNRKEKIFIKESSILIPLLKNLNGERYSKVPKYPLHRDINPENTLWKNKKLVGVIDFENVGSQNDTIIKDISGMLQYSCRDKKNKYKLDLKLAKFFLQEYRKYHPLSDEDIRFIPEVIIAGSIEDFSYAYWMLINDPKRAKLYRLKLYSKVSQWYSQNKANIIKKLTN